MSDKQPVPYRIHAVDVAGPNLITFCPVSSQQFDVLGIKFDEIFIRTELPVNCKSCLSSIELFKDNQLEGDPVLGDYRVILKPVNDRWAAANKQRHIEEKAAQERAERLRKEREEAERLRREAKAADDRADTDRSDAELLIKYLPRLVAALEKEEATVMDYNRVMRAVPRILAHVRKMRMDRSRAHRAFDSSLQSHPRELFVAGYLLALEQVEEFLITSPMMPAVEESIA